MTYIDPTVELTSNRTLVRQKITAYLNKGLAEGQVLSAGKVFPHPPKLTRQSDLYALALPGQPDGAAIFMYISTQGEHRLAAAGTPQRGVAGSGGRKARIYSLTLLCYFMWKGDKAQDADEANDQFIDSLTSWIELDRNAGTAAVANGGDGSGVIFCWGEGADVSSIPGGKDVQVHTSFPRDMKGQGTQVFNMVDVAVIAIMQT